MASTKIINVLKDDKDEKELDEEIEDVKEDEEDEEIEEIENEESAPQFSPAIYNEENENGNYKVITISKTKKRVDDNRNVWKEESERAQTENIWTGINSRTQKSFKNFPKNSLIILGVISVVLLGTIVYISTGSAKINLTP